MGYERVIGTIRRECLDRLIPISESHLQGKSSHDTKLREIMTVDVIWVSPKHTK